MTMRNKDAAKQCLARAIEDSSPATLTEFIDTILPAPSYSEGQRHLVQKRAIEYAKKNYSLEPLQ